MLIRFYTYLFTLMWMVWGWCVTICKMYVFENNFYPHNFWRLFAAVNTSWVSNLPLPPQWSKGLTFVSRKEYNLVSLNEMGYLDNTSYAFPLFGELSHSFSDMQFPSSISCCKTSKTFTSCKDCSWWSQAAKPNSFFLAGILSCRTFQLLAYQETRSERHRPGAL